MEEYCGSTFWDYDKVWNSDNPDFTPCFEQTVLLWGPCIFLYVFALLDFFYIRSSLDKDIPWNILNTSKIVINAILILISAIDFIYALANKEKYPVHPVDIYSPLIKIAAFILAGVLCVLNKKHGVRTSGLLFLFWFLLTVFSIPRCRTEVFAKQLRDKESSYPAANEYDDYKYVTFMIFFACSIAMLILNCFGDQKPNQTKYPKSEKECPELAASFLSKVTYQWFDRMAWHGFRKPLELEDLWDLRPVDSSKEVMPVFAKHWNKSVQKKLERNQAIENGFTMPSSETKATFNKNSASVTFQNPNVGSTKQQASIMPPIIKSFGGIFLFGSALKLINDILTFVSPQLLRLIINFVDNDGKEPEPQWKGALYAVSLFVVASFQTLVLGQYFHRMFIVGLRIRTALINAIYRKALVISNSAKKESTVGEIVNLMAVDAQRFMDLTTYLNMIWSAPLQIGAALYFLYDILGPSVFAGLAVMIILIPINGVIANKIKDLQIRQMKNKDDRVKLMNEVLSGIKVLKLYAWEPSFEEQVLEIRNKEIDVLKKTAYLNAGTSFLWSCAPFLVSLVTFAVYVLVDENHVLNATTAFVSLSLFNILRFPLSMLPMLISNMVQTQVSVTRINKFMNSEELDPNNVSHDNSEPNPLIIESGNFSWGDEDLILRDINMKVAKHQLVAVVGTVGSGKSSLINAFLGEMDKKLGRVNTVGKVAYVPQQAWIQNATVRENILFGKPFDRKKYERVIEACALKADIEMLSAGDSTEIGEKGINLSGGQKQRVSLARAVYSDSDIYLLDDPLSAVDSHVGKHIFEEVIGPKGLLSKKTTVLVTHGLTFLPIVDNIFVLKDGQISESGTYQELLNKKGAFSEFLIQHLQEANVEDDLEEIQQQLEGSIQSKELLQQLNRAISRQRSESQSSDTVSLNSDEGGSGDHKGLRKRKSIDRQNSKTSDSSSALEKPEKKLSKEDDGKLIEKETSQTGSVKFAVYKHYLKSIGLRITIATILLNATFQGFAIGSNLWLSTWSSDKEAAKPEVRDMYLGVYGAFGVGQALVVWVTALVPMYGFIRAALLLHHNLLKNTLKLKLSHFDITPTGRILSRFSKDVEIIDSLIPEVIKTCLYCLFQVLSTLVVISISTPIFIAVIIPIAALYYFAQRFYVATSRQLMRLESVSRSPIYSHFGETITGTQTIRAYSVQQRFIDESDERVDKNQVCKYPSVIANRWLAIRLEMVGNLIILFASLFAVLGGQTNAGLVGLSVTYSLQVTQTLNWLVRMTSDIETNIVAVERIKEYSETKQEAPWNLPSENISKEWPVKGKVDFVDFEVRYREGLDLVLKGITFTVQGGEKVGIVGRTGAGKSSLTLALFRIIESAGGKILIDDVDISTLGLHSLRSRLTIIPQDPVLFSGSLRINLDPFNKNSDDELWKALELAHLKSFVKGLSAGLMHEISEGGENLSIGQRQLVCLARAVLRKTKVLILDEATAAVDLETDDLIQKTIRSEFKDCTVLTIAHRLNTILDSDKVIVLDKGKVVEFASPGELLQNKKTIFYGMAKDANLVRETISSFNRREELLNKTENINR
ncbi:multidrug resistance-associated protein 1 isoform X7 [Condylostylus longicornis]|uniref:multidrug resistance-associated protein 1 isoform X7 n=2 Tax=Condylostylus longicornis TaxID=2530218 RepID=UPI00244E37AF|nr:multidrug resistance-associated protein 1 isoform X7 [Condylostylus longicornis]